ncbi:MAG: CDP-diacylglycerol--serine O-phosphatidyltransferase [Gammaproteobacteria bacterium]|nr:CDP-diacylglycerol--serine O-phosphatidyltransferase [Gammaproteobacteria bacterium]
MRRLRPRRAAAYPEPARAGIPVPAEAISLLESPEVFRAELLALIARAERRILLCALYLQDDGAGRELLAALHAAKQARPELDVAVFVDWHRAQRGLIGKSKSEGNAACYREYAQAQGDGVAIYGVPVQNRELFGVLHTKGFVIDDSLLYSGASLNEIYLGSNGRYRLDRYHRIDNAPLADSLAGYLNGVFRTSSAVHRLDRPAPPATKALNGAIRALRAELSQAQYAFPPGEAGPGQVCITPLAGLGRGDNALSRSVLALIASATRELVLFTPYFNLPTVLRDALNKALGRGVRLTLVLGDKTANDFYIPPGQTFTTIGLLPYLYEGNLRRYARAQHKALAAGQLDIRLWRKGDNSYHLKGLMADGETYLLTGNNLNPRAFSLDLENGLLIRDPQGLLKLRHEAELAAILAQCTRLSSHQDLESPRQYPEAVRKLLKRLNGVRMDRLLNRLL